jgi:hypothetical protein
MGDIPTRNPTAIWIGALLSTGLLLLFLYLKYCESSVLELPPQWLLVALVPIVVGLVVGGYIRELKAVDYGVDFATDKILAKSKVIADSGAIQNAKSANPVLASEWQSERAAEYARTNGYMLAHIYRRSKEAGQKFDISIFVVRHEKGNSTPPRDNLGELKSAEFFWRVLGK